MLIYHRVGGGSGLDVDLPVERVRRADGVARRRGRVSTLARRARRARSHAARAAGPQRDDVSVVVTFDDGTADFADNALPILERHGIPVTLYAATAFIDEGRPFPDDGPPLSWAALRDACATGLVDVGSHTHHHGCSTGSPPDEIDARARPFDRAHRRARRRAPLDFAYPKAVLGSPAARAGRAQPASVPRRSPAPGPTRSARPIRTGCSARRSSRATASGGSCARPPAGWRSRTTCAGGSTGGATRRPPRDDDAARRRARHDDGHESRAAARTAARSAGRRGFDVVGASAPGPYVERSGAARHRHIPLRARDASHGTGRGRARARRAGRRSSARLRPAIVHTHNPKPGLYGRVAAPPRARPGRRQHRARSVRAPGGSRARSARSCTASNASRPRARTPSCCRTRRISRRSAACGVPERRLTILGNGIDLTRFDPASRDRRRRAKRRATELGADGAPTTSSSASSAGSCARRATRSCSCRPRRCAPSARTSASR